MANRQPSGRKIHRVPLLLRRVEHNRDDYEPKVVSFGPYHHGKPELELCQYAKNLTFQMFVDGSGLSPEFLKSEVFKIIADARSCYDEGSVNVYADEYFVDMMLLDACFLIYYMNIVDDRNRRHWIYIYNFLGRLVFNMVTRDMFLLENQIPFRVLMLLIKLRYDNGEEAVSKFLHQTIWGHYKQPQSQDILEQQIQDIHQGNPPLHMLETYRRVLVWDFTPRSLDNLDAEADTDFKKFYKAFRSAINLKAKGIYFRPSEKKSLKSLDAEANTDFKKFYKAFRSAINLKAKGIYFRPSEKKSLKSINFNSFTFNGQLELPVWFVSNLSKVFFLNMIAYELCPNNLVDTTVISYLTFMKSLIENPADVKELREKRILLTTLGSDEDVVRLYRDLDTFETNDIYSFLEVKERIQKHYDSKAKTWKAELIHAYLSSPWSIIAWVAGLLLLVLTFLQTYFTICNK